MRQCYSLTGAPSPHHAEPGTARSTQCKPCFTFGFEEFLPCCAHISKATTVIGLISSDVKGLKEPLKNSTFLHDSSRQQTGEYHLPYF